MMKWSPAIYLYSPPTFIITQSCWVNQAEEDFYLKQIKWAVLKEAVPSKTIDGVADADMMQILFLQKLVSREGK